MDKENFEYRSNNLSITANDHVISGYAAVFYDGSPETEFQIAPGVYERIDRSAFDMIMNDQSLDVIASVDHDMKTILARRSAGDLKLSVDAKGLKYEIQFDKDDPDHSRIFAKLRKNHYRGSSFTFGVVHERPQIQRASKEHWQLRDHNSYVVTQSEINLWEVGPCLRPTYKGATANYRSLGLAQFQAELAIQELDNFLKEIDGRIH